jgi:hypothetical protein
MHVKLIRVMIEVKFLVSEENAQNVESTLIQMAKIANVYQMHVTFLLKC